jgi:endonuclease/exonuclease/phosphatase family metal-dependent hydrolase
MKAKKTKRSLFGKIMAAVTIALWLALIASYFAPYIDPQSNWIFAFFGLAYPFLLIANLILAIYWVASRRWYGLISFIIIACGWGMLNNNFGLHIQSSEPFNPSNLLHIMTYNVHNFKRYGAKNDTSTKHEILDIIYREQPDIIGFQEFYTRNQGQYDMRDSLVKIMGGAYYYFEPVIFNSSEAIGIAIFSKFPIIDRGFIPFSDKKSENACIYVDVKKGDKIFRVYSVHLQSIRFDPEDYKYIKNITGGQGTSDASSAWRVGGKLKIAFIKRSAQVAKIKENTAHCPYPYIISGDFNDTPASFAVNEMATGLKNAFSEKGVGFGRTYNGSFPNFQIDYIMASRQFDVLNYHIIEKKLSDHYPVWSDLVLSR